MQCSGKVTDLGGSPSPPLRTQFSAKKELRIWGVPFPPFTDKIRKVVFDVLPYVRGVNGWFGGIKVCTMFRGLSGFGLGTLA